jgi:hypothetical protein
MKKMPLLIPIGLLILIVLIPSSAVLGQCADGAPFVSNGCCIDSGNAFCQIGAGPTGCPDCVEIPLDGGLSALFFVGFAFVAKRIYSKK